jgi:hypothetical protein
MSDQSKFPGPHFSILRAGDIERQLGAGVRARLFPGMHAMLSVVTFEPHSWSLVPSHPDEQWGVCLEGSWSPNGQGLGAATLPR